MLIKDLNDIYVIVSIAIGVFAILLELTYLYEAIRGYFVMSYDVYKKYINASFVIFLTLYVFLWLTSPTMETFLLQEMFWFIVAWFVIGLIGLIASVFLKIKIESKQGMRKALLPCITRVLIMVVLLWFVY